MDNNKIVQSLWIGDKLTNMEQLCIKSYLQNGHDFHLYVYEDIQDIPIGTTVIDANNILPSSLMFTDSKNRVSSFSDYFRYQLLYDKGGWWVDMDSICLKYLDIKNDYCFATERNFGQVNICSGFIKSPAGADFLKEMLDYIDERGTSNIIWGEYGPFFIDRIVKTYECEEYIADYDVFMPINDGNEPFNLIGRNEHSFSDKTLVIHLYNSLWNVYGLDKNGNYHPYSIYETYKKLYNV